MKYMNGNITTVILMKNYEVVYFNNLSTNYYTESFKYGIKKEQLKKHF